MTDAVREALRQATHDGMEAGLQMAVDILKEYAPMVARENQSFDSAAAVLALAKSRYHGIRMQNDEPTRTG